MIPGSFNAYQFFNQTTIKSLQEDLHAYLYGEVILKQYGESSVNTLPTQHGINPSQLRHDPDRQHAKAFIPAFKKLTSCGNNTDNASEWLC